MMDKEPQIRYQKRARDILVLKYLDAFERNNDELIEAILTRADEDPELALQIWDAHIEYQRLQEEEEQESASSIIRDLLQEHLPSAHKNPLQEEEIPPLRVGDVIARIQSDAAGNGRYAPELHLFDQHPQYVQQPLPGSMGMLGVRKFFISLGLQVSREFQRLFSNAALDLLSRRDQGIAQMTATRKQQEMTNKQADRSHEHGTGNREHHSGSL